MSKKNTKARRKKIVQSRLKADITRKQLLQQKINQPVSLSNFGRRITKRQFDGYCYCRQPLVRYTVEEVEWYSLFSNKLLAIIVKDITDQDYGFIILGRDSRRLFRCIDLGSTFWSNPKVARYNLARHIQSRYAGNVHDIYPQGDEVSRGIDLFSDVIDENRMHHLYKLLAKEPRFEAARNLLTEIVNSFIDNDGHYEREFQSVNFHSRLWELYLHTYFNNAAFIIDNNHASPDFELSFFGYKYFVEAVTVNKSEDPIRPDLPPPATEPEIQSHLNDFMPIKFGSSLFSKLLKKYWEKDHVKGNPLLIAIHDYHNDTAMTWSRTALSEYLYGIRTRVVNGEAKVEKIVSHEWNGKKIPSAFFYQENAENISAVLFSNQCTIPKFNRMGKLAGLGSKDVMMIRKGYCFNPDPDALYPIFFSRNVDDDDYEESWSDGLVMFHNPNAIYPVDLDHFSDISHIFFSEEKGFHGIFKPYEVLGSITIALSPENPNRFNRTTDDNGFDLINPTRNVES